MASAAAADAMRSDAHMHASARLMWDEYRAHCGDSAEALRDIPPAWHFCDNESDANECAELVASGVKRATSPSLASFETAGEALPQPGDLNIVTLWQGQAVCIIRTTRVQILPFDQITELHARIEGEGDGSLEWWRTVHWSYYQRELEQSGQSPTQGMPVVFQEFERVFPVRASQQPVEDETGASMRSEG